MAKSVRDLWFNFESCVGWRGERRYRFVIPGGAIGNLAGKVVINAAANAIGNVAQQLITGRRVNWTQVGAQAAVGRAVGVVANYVSLGAALNGVDNGMSAAAAIEASEGVGVGAGMLPGIDAHNYIPNDYGGYGESKPHTALEFEL